ncbi:MAG: hypothetical protein QOJ57_717 [Thermoleophilaceae bacterium]|jgi:hypothetical protein|nr:hypothetical protein [Thermoleophilaceae bacterium]
MLQLIDTRNPPPAPGSGGRAPWEPNWRLWAWVALAIGAGVAAELTSGLVAYALICATLVFVCQAVCVLLPDTFGLREYRQ